MSADSATKAKASFVILRQDDFLQENQYWAKIHFILDAKLV